MKIFNKSIYLFLIISFLISLFPSWTFAKESTSQDDDKGSFIILVLDQICLEDIANSDLTNFKFLIDNGAIGIMNTLPEGKRIADNTFLTVATSSQVTGFPYAYSAFNAKDILLKDDFLNQSISDNAIIQSNIEELKKLNSNNSYLVDIGSLGATLQDNHISTSVWGNSDLSIEKHNFYEYGRQAVCLLMNRQGLVDNGDISEDILIENLKHASGVKTNTSKLLKLFSNNYTSNQAMVIDYGDTSRNAYYLENIDPIVAKEQMNLTLKEADVFLGELLKIIDLKKDCLMILSPTPSPLSISQNNTFTPLIMTGKKIEPGLLTSNSTHQQGIITNLDIAPTILNFFDLEPPKEMYGDIITNTNGKISLLLEKEGNLINYSLRKVPILVGLSIYFLLLLIASLIIFNLDKINITPPKKVFSVLQFNYLSFFNIPLIILLLGAFANLSPNNSLIFLTALTILLTAILYPVYCKKGLSFYLAIICLGTIGTIFFDLFVNQSSWLLYSPLGYDLQRGARFYGIGNEYLGIIIGSSSLGMTCLYELKKTQKNLFLIFTLMLLIILIMIYPGLGSNAGSSFALSAIIFGLLISLLGDKLSRKQLIFLISTIIAIILFIFISDSIQAPQTHIGKAILTIQNNGIESAFDIICRKLTMNYELMKYSWGSYIMIIGLFILLIIFKLKPHGLKKLQANSPYVLKGCYIALWGSIISFFTNDSGIVSACIAMIYPIFAMICVKLIDYTSK